MKVLDTIISLVFSIIMLMVSIVLILVGLGIVDSEVIIDLLRNVVFTDEMFSNKVFNPITITGLILFLASLKTTIFLSLFKVKKKAPIEVKTKNGVVQITPETLIATAKSATMMYENVKDVSVKLEKTKRGVIITENLEVYSNTNIKDLTDSIQKDIKDRIASTTGVQVKEVKFNVKNANERAKAVVKPQIASVEKAVAEVKEEADEIENKVEETIETSDEVVEEIQEASAELDEIIEEVNQDENEKKDEE